MYCHSLFSCFLPPGNSLNFGLLLEMGIMTLVNLIVFILLVRKVVLRPMMSKYTKGKRQKEAFDRIQQFVLFWVFLGMSWIFAYLSIIIKREDGLVFEILFCLFTSLQGFVLFVFICGKNEEFRKSIKDTKNIFAHKESYKVKTLSQATASVSLSVSGAKLTATNNWDDEMIPDEITE